MSRGPARRRRVRWIAVGAAVIAVIAVVYLWRERGPVFTIEPSADQNVVLVTIDTLRADAMSSYGGPAKTPNLDQLAAHGARFTFAHAHAVVTLPSHTTILTGQFPYVHGIRDNSGFRVKDGTVTIATRLKALGFATGAFIGGFPLTKRFGLSPGFDTYDDQLPEIKGEVENSLPERRADVVVSRAVDWIGQQQARFFAWVHCYDPHSPYTPPPEYAAEYRAQPYYGEIAFVDHALGPLFDRLATLPRSTLVIVTADHGESLGEHGEATHGMFAYEATLHVPLIIAHIPGTQAPGAHIPGTQAPGAHIPGNQTSGARTPGAHIAGTTGTAATRGVVIDVPVRHIDIVPTLLDAVGATADATLPGSSLRDVIRTGQSADRPGYFESMTYNLVRGWAPLRGVLVKRDKYIDLPIPELYDLAADPKEAHNDAADQADHAKMMFNTLRTYNIAPPNRPGAETAENRAQLNALGYISGSAPARQVYTEADDPKRLVEVDKDLHTATTLYQDGKLEEAIAMMNSVIARRPDTSDAYISLAHAYWEAGRIEPAIATLEHGLAAGAPDRDIRIRLGLYLAESHMSRASTDRAITLLGGLPTTDVEALNGLGIAYIDAERYDDAVREFTLLLTLDPTNGLAFQNLAVIALKRAKSTSGAASERNLKDAERYATQAIQVDPSLAGVYTILGVIYQSGGQKDRAIQSWIQAITLDGQEFDALDNLWQELALAGRRDEAVKYGRQFLNTAPPAFYKEDLDKARTFLGG